MVMDSKRQALEPYLAGARERREAEGRAVIERRDTALALVPRLAARLRGEFGAERIWLVGSLEEGGFHLTSDIDLVVEGLRGVELLRAWRAVEDMAGPELRVDLIPWEDTTEALRAHTFRAGRLIDDAA